MSLPVLFRLDTRGPHAGEITAVFPTLPASPGCLTCYAHIGQHSSCSLEWLGGRGQRAAKPVKYASLLAELHTIGYTNLKVCRRITTLHRRQLAATLHGIRQRAEAQ